MQHKVRVSVLATTIQCRHGGSHTVAAIKKCSHISKSMKCQVPSMHRQALLSDCYYLPGIIFGLKTNIRWHILTAKNDIHHARKCKIVGIIRFLSIHLSERCRSGRRELAKVLWVCLLKNGNRYGLKACCSQGKMFKIKIKKECTGHAKRYT